jgi:LysM repeat protein
MSHSNPLIPQGSLLEQQAKGRPHLRIALCIVAVHVVFLGGLLMQGCKREDTTDTAGLTTELPPLDLTNLYAPPTLDAPTNVAAPLPASNQVQVGLAAGGTSTNLSLPITAPPDAIVPLPAIDAVPATREYVVAKGDSFFSIGRKFGVTPSAIGKANPGVDSTRLQIGQKLQIPAPASATPTAVGLASTPGTGVLTAESDTYTVKSGDNLSRIARNHNTTVGALKALNGLTTDRINVGQKLKVPARALAPEALPPATTSSPASTPGTQPF